MSNKGLRLPAEPLTDDEVQALIQCCNPRFVTGSRNRALIGVLYRCGLRISEALDLRVADVDVAGGSVRILHGKGDKARTVGLDDGAAHLIQQWIEVRASLPVTLRSPLICTHSGGRMLPSNARRLFARLGRKAGLAKRVHPHGLRHSHAAQLADEGVPVHVIQRQLGHSNVSVTSRYIDHLNPQEVINAIRSRTWTAA